jgi:hypothetical protein
MHRPLYVVAVLVWLDSAPRASGKWLEPADHQGTDPLLVRTGEERDVRNRRHRQVSSGSSAVSLVATNCSLCCSVRAAADWIHSREQLLRLSGEPPQR